MTKNYMIGNWKMNQSQSEISSFFERLNSENLSGNFFIAPQLIHIPLCKNLTSLNIASQNISKDDKGAHTGEISPLALKEMGINYSLIGHSERRSIYGESDELINLKVINTLKNKMTPIICIGETLEQRESDLTLKIVLGQIKSALKEVKLTSSDDIILAYEPVWAIGTGKTASSEQAQEVHSAIRSMMKESYGEAGERTSILYGGSVKPANIEDLLAQKDINGGLVGGASLKAEDFISLCRAASN